MAFSGPFPYTPPTVPVGMVREAQRRPERAIARIAGPVATGGSVLRIAGTWSFVQHPSQAQIDSVDLDTGEEGNPPLFFQGGHTYMVRQDILNELALAGLVPE